MGDLDSEPRAGGGPEAARPPTGDGGPELMARAMAGDGPAYGRIFELYRPGIYNIAYAILHNDAGAEDVVQETFAKGFDRISTFRSESSPKAWLSSIAINACRHRLRENRRGVEQAGERVLDGGRRLWRPRTRGAASKLVQNESQRLLAIALGYLTEQQREVFLLHYEQELPYDEIGQILGIRSGAARALAHRAKAALRQRLESEVWISKQVPVV